MRNLLPLLLFSGLVLADDNRLQPDHAPTPFSAAEIRAGCPKGRKSTFRVKHGLRPAFLQTFRFITNDETGTILEVSRATENGMPVGKPKRSKSQWKQLQAHASYPEAKTKITTGRTTTPAGTFACKVYVVAWGGDRETRLYFAERIPGPPVRVTQTLKGKETMSMVLVEHRLGNEAAILKAFGADPAKAFAKLDGDDDGKLTPKELTEHFARFDRDADGSVARAEFLEVWTEWSAP